MELGTVELGTVELGTVELRYSGTRYSGTRQNGTYSELTGIAVIVSKLSFKKFTMRAEQSICNYT